jgi:hypothetical protein
MNVGVEWAVAGQLRWREGKEQVGLDGFQVSFLLFYFL